MMSVQGAAPDPRRQYSWWRGSWWTWEHGGWYLYTEARQSQEPNRNTHCQRQVHLPRAGGAVEGWFRWHHDGIDIFDTGLDAPPPFTDLEWRALRRSPESSWSKQGSPSAC